MASSVEDRDQKRTKSEGLGEGRLQQLWIKCMQGKEAIINILRYMKEDTD